MLWEKWRRARRRKCFKCAISKGVSGWPAEMVTPEQNLMEGGYFVFFSGKVCRVNGECPQRSGGAPCIFDGQQDDLFEAE